MSGTTLVLGLGRFGGGAAAARFLHRRGARLRIADRQNGPDLDPSRHRLADLQGVDWQLGREDAALLDGVDRIVVNPAIPSDHALLQKAGQHGIACTQEANLFLEHYPGRIVGVTGTNGKSTTSTLVHAALQRSGLDTLLGGNIGHSLLDDEARWSKDQIAVLEISSFQLERTDPARHRVAGAVCTRVMQDHLDRHRTLQAYQQAKARLPAMATAFFVHAADDAVAATFASPAPQRIVFAEEPPQPRSMGVRDGWLAARLHDGAAVPLVHTGALQLLGDFQRENALAAAAAALLLGASEHGTGLALACALPLPFRLQLVAVHRGVRIYDNGVSTEVESTRSALRNLEGPIRWVGGGKSKDGNFAAVADAVAERITSAHLFGAAAEPLAAALHGRRPASVHPTLAAALDQAMAACRPGDALLFSPAFASFDQYPNFRARALDFHGWLAARRRDAASTAPE